MILFKLTKSAENSRLLQGISLQDIEDTLIRGIKTRDNQTIISSYNNVLVHHLTNGLRSIIVKIAIK